MKSELQDNYVPVIKGAKNLTQNVFRRYYLNTEEKRMLYGIYVRRGFDKNEASKRVNEFNKYLKELVKKLKRLDKSDEMIELKVNEEFEIFCRKIDLSKGE